MCGFEKNALGGSKRIQRGLIKHRKKYFIFIQPYHKCSIKPPGTTYLKSDTPEEAY